MSRSSNGSDVPSSASGGGQATAAVRWGGAALALCALAFTVTILLYVFLYGQPVGTGVGGEVTLRDKAMHVLDRWGLISKVWLIESVAWMLMSVAGFVLQERTPSGPAWFPSRAAWAAVGVGAVMQAVMYAFMLGGYPVAAAGREASPMLFGTMQGAAMILFYLSNAAVYFGLGGVFLAETSRQGVLPRWLALCAMVVCFLVAVLMLGLLAGVGKMMYAAPGALLGFLAVIWLGLSIRRHG